MRAFKKQASLAQNMAYMGMMAAVNIVFILLTRFVPFLLFVLVFTLPLCSAIISFYCKKRYFPIFLIVVSAICLLIDLSDTIFYVIPSLLTGFFFGLCIDKKVPSIFVIVLISIIQFGLSLLSIPLIKLITNRDIVNDFAVLFKVDGFIYFHYIKYPFIYFVSFAQTIITYIVMRSELSKFAMEFKDLTSRTYILDVFTIISLAMSIATIFIIEDMTFTFLIIAFIFMFYRLSLLDYKYYKIYLIELVVIILISLFLIALIYQKIKEPLGFLTIGIFPLLISFTCIVNFCLLNKDNKDTINN